MQKDNGEIYYKHYYLDSNNTLNCDEISEDEYLIETNIYSRKLTK